MISKRIAGVLGAAVIVAGSAAAVIHAQGQQPPTDAPARHGRPGPDGPGGPGGPLGGFFGRGPGGPGGPGGPLAMLRQLDLSEEQRTQVRQVMESHADELRGIGERLRAAHKAQDDAVTAQAFDENAIRAKAADVAAVMADAAVLHAKVHGEVFAILTPEQQAKAAELKAQREARMSQMRDRVRERIKERRQRRAAPEAQ